MSTRNRGLKDYMALDYPMEVTRDEFGYFVRIPDLPGCESSGENLDEAIASIEEAKEAWIGVALEAGRSIPRPRGEDDYSGKFVVRVGPTIHRDLVRIAALEGMSLNALVTTVLARETGRFSATFCHEESGTRFSRMSTEEDQDLVCTSRSVGDWVVHETVKAS